MAQVEQQIKPRVLVTGASGFVGHALCDRLEQFGYAVRRSCRNALPAKSPAAVDSVVTGELCADTDWSDALAGISIVFHLAARTHVLSETNQDAIAEFRRINIDGTRALAQAAVRAGVRRMVFLSSIKVTGERTFGRPFSEDTPPQPEDAYGISKLAAEKALSSVAAEAPLETVILRPPLVYGPGVKGNFLRLMQWISRGIPLPLMSIDNRRSLIYVNNLADAIIAAGASPIAAGKTYLVSDGEDISTPDLIRLIANALRVQPRLFRCPSFLLRTLSQFFGKDAALQRLTGSLQLDNSRICRELDWKPDCPLEQGLAHTAQWYHSRLSEKSNR